MAGIIFNKTELLFIYAYDKHGNLIEVEKASGKIIKQYTYDAANQLVKGINPTFILYIPA